MMTLPYSFNTTRTNRHLIYANLLSIVILVAALALLYASEILSANTIAKAQVFAPIMILTVIAISLFQFRESKGGIVTVNPNMIVATGDQLFGIKNKAPTGTYTGADFVFLQVYAPASHYSQVILNSKNPAHIIKTPFMQKTQAEELADLISSELNIPRLAK